MKRYVYYVELSISVDAETDNDAWEIVDLILPSETNCVKRNLVELVDTYPIDEEAVDDR